MRRWAIIIGINQYQLLQPLCYAQQDAQELQKVLVHEIGFEPTQCILLCDASSPVSNLSTFPDQASIQTWLEQIKQSLQPGDLLWLFFSGYGVCDQGRDYLIPIDGNPAELEKTAISVHDILHWLKDIPAHSKLLLLDMSRNQSSLPNQTVGTQTAQLAASLKIPTILSCQPGQFSHDVIDLQQGFFTAALLEGLHYQPYPTAASLYQLLSNRLPELSRHYWRPIQQPWLVCPPDQLHQVILPDEKGAVAGIVPHGSQSWVNQLSLMTAGSDLKTNDGSAAQVAVSQSAESNQGDVYRRVQAAEQLQQNQENGSHPTTIEEPSTTLVDEDESATELHGGGLRSPLLWGSLTTAVLLLGVLERNWGSFTPASPVSFSNAAIKQPGATIPVSPRPNSSPSPGIGSPAPTQPNSSPDTPAPPPTASVKLAPPTAGNTPSDAGQENPSRLVIKQKAKVGTQPPKPTKPVLSPANAKVLIQSDQASPFWYAIQRASQVKPEEPGYNEAQQNVASWSQDILTIANQRAKQGRFETAIMAAALVPQNQTTHVAAERAIARWCYALAAQRRSNSAHQKQAKTICQNQ